jgi:hypothetical protein
MNEAALFLDDLGRNPLLGQILLSQEFTIEAWIKLEKEEDLPRIIMDHQSHFQISYAKFDSANIILAFGSTNGIPEVEHSGIEKEVFYHLAFSNSELLNKSFITVNADIESEGISIPPILNSADLYLGRHSAGDDRHSNAEMTIRELRIWNELRIRGAVHRNMRNRIDLGEAQGVLMYWKMNEGEGSTLSDSITNAVLDISENHAPEWIISSENPLLCEANEYYQDSLNLCEVIPGTHSQQTLFLNY